MKLAMYQMSMSSDRKENLSKAVSAINAQKNNDLILFPEVMLTPFFPQYRKEDLLEALGLTTDDILTTPEDDFLHVLRDSAAAAGIYVSPNVYAEQGDGCFDTSFLIDRWGKVIGDTEMAHIISAEYFYEKDYYSPSTHGYEVFETDFGKVAIVICFDRHFPEAIRTCAAKGAELILVPAANTKIEPLDVFEAEMRAAAYQNNVFIAMCNRVGHEGNMDFAGESLVVDPYGRVILKADDKEGLLTCELNFDLVQEARRERPFIDMRRKEFYR